MGEVSKQTAREVEDAREAYLRVLESAAKEAGINVGYASDAMLQLGENIACEGRVVDASQA